MVTVLKDIEKNCYKAIGPTEHDDGKFCPKGKKLGHESLGDLVKSWPTQYLNSGTEINHTGKKQTSPRTLATLSLGLKGTQK